MRSSIRGDKPRGRLSETTGGKNQNLPVKSKYRCQGYALMNPFFQNRKNGFLPFNLDTLYANQNAKEGLNRVAKSAKYSILILILYSIE